MRIHDNLLDVILSHSDKRAAEISGRYSSPRTARHSRDVPRWLPCILEKAILHSLGPRLHRTGRYHQCRNLRHGPTTIHGMASQPIGGVALA
jgi:hypothetical protein